MSSPVYKDQTHILIIDDEVDIVELLKEEWEESGFIVSVAHSAKAGIKILSESSVDIVMCDYKMPDGNGLVVLEALNLLDKRPLFYLVTGQSDITSDQEEELGITRCIAKPFDLYGLLDMIEKDYLKHKGQSAFTQN